MKYRVRVDDGAARSIAEYAKYLAVDQQAPQAAQSMLERIWDAIDSLEQWPKRFPLAPENEYRVYEIRMAIVASSLLLFVVSDEERLVKVIGFRHGRQRPISDLPK